MSEQDYMESTAGNVEGLENYDDIVGFADIENAEHPDTADFDALAWDDGEYAGYGEEPIEESIDDVMPSDGVEADSENQSIDEEGVYGQDIDTFEEARGRNYLADMFSREEESATAMRIMRESVNLWATELMGDVAISKEEVEIIAKSYYEATPVEELEEMQHVRETLDRFKYDDLTAIRKDPSHKPVPMKVWQARKANAQRAAQRAGKAVDMEAPTLYFGVERRRKSDNVPWRKTVHAFSDNESRTAWIVENEKKVRKPTTYESRMGEIMENPVEQVKREPIGEGKSPTAVLVHVYGERFRNQRVVNHIPTDAARKETGRVEKTQRGSKRAAGDFEHLPIPKKIKGTGENCVSTFERESSYSKGKMETCLKIKLPEGLAEVEANYGKHKRSVDISGGTIEIPQRQRRDIRNTEGEVIGVQRGQLKYYLKTDYVILDVPRKQNDGRPWTVFVTSGKPPVEGKKPTVYPVPYMNIQETLNKYRAEHLASGANGKAGEQILTRELGLSSHNEAKASKDTRASGAVTAVAEQKAQRGVEVPNKAAKTRKASVRDDSKKVKSETSRKRELARARRLGNRIA